MFTLQSDNSEITLAAKPLGRGGEGQVFKIETPVNHIGNVVKIFLPTKQTLDREKKLKYLIANPPKIKDNHGNILVLGGL
jgi:DNA-binding helix-hairpin-helix protein with protein kinase domain